MSSPSITVRYDAQNSEAVISANNKIVGSLNAMRTITGQTTTTVKQMEAGFRADIFSNFGTSVASADAKITSFRAKLSQIGQGFAQNATSFGVATASIWGIYNAYDSLEKVQIRAHAASQRVSTLETTIATLTERRRLAVEKGNLSAEQMAILDDRITNAHGKLAVAQERNADLQQDVNEAWAGFVSQVGPQTVAAASSVVQVVTSLRGQMGGVVPAIKNFVTSLLGSTGAMGSTTGASLLLRPALGGIGPAAEVGAVGVRALSGALKGLLIGTGIGALVVGIGFVIEALTGLNQASAESSSQTVDSFGEAAKGSQAYSNATKQHLDAADEIIKKHAETTKNTLQDMNADYIKSVKDQLDFDKQLQEASVKKTAAFLKDATARRDALVEEGKTTGAALLTIKYGLGGYDKALATANEQVRVFTDSNQASSQGLELIKEKLLAVNPAYQAAVEKQKAQAAASDLLNNNLKELLPSWDKTTEAAKRDVDAMIESQKSTILATGSLEEAKGPLEAWIKLHYGSAGSLNLNSVAMAELDKKLKELFPDTEKQTKAEEKLTKQLEDEAAAQAEIILKSELQRQQISKVAEETQKENDALEAVFGSRAVKTAADLQGTDAAKALVDISTQQIDKYKKEEESLVTLAASWGIHNDLLLDAIANEGDDVAALQDLIVSNETLNTVLQDKNRIFEDTNKGLVQGRQAAVDWYDQMRIQIASDQQFTEDQKIIAQQFKEELPAGIQLTKDQMTSLITSFHDAGKFGQAMGQVLDEVFSESRSALQDLVDTAVKGGKDWKEKWKDIKNLIPKNVRDDAKAFVEDQADILESINKIIPKLEIYRAIWDSPTFSKKEKKSATSDLADDLKKVGDELDDISSIDIDGEIIGPLLKLKEGGLTKDELNTWDQFFNLYAKLAAEGGGIDENDVEILRQFVANHTGMSDLATATGDTSDETANLSDAQKKAKDNFLVAATIKLVTDQLNLQGRAVRGLASDFNQLVLIMQKMASIKANGNPSGNGFQNVSDNHIPFDPNFQRTPGDVDNTVKNIPQTVTVVFTADIKKFLTAADAVVKRIDFIDKLRPIVDFLGDHRAFMKAAIDVFNRVSAIDKLRPIVDFLGDHRQFMKAAIDVFNRQAAIDKLRPIVDFLGDHRQFMRAASDVESKVDEIDGMVATVTIKAKRVGNFSAQHGMHATLAEDAFIYAHKNERVDISPPGDHTSGLTRTTNNNNSTNISGPSMVHLEVPVYLFPGASVLKKLVREIPLEDTGMYASA